MRKKILTNKLARKGLQGNPVIISARTVFLLTSQCYYQKKPQKILSDFFIGDDRGEKGGVGVGGSQDRVVAKRAISKRVK